MKILQVSDFYPPVKGGLENHVADLARALSRRGHQVQVATLTANPASTDEIPCQTIANAVAKRVHYVDQERRFHTPLPDVRSRHELTALLERFRPDVIHGHSWLAASIPSRWRKRLVFTAHDYALGCQLRTFLDSDINICRAPGMIKCVRCASVLPGSARHVAMMASTRIGRQLLRPARVLAVSESVQMRLQPFVDRAIEVVPNFIDIDGVLSEASTRPSSRRYVLFAGDPGLHKGVPHLLDAWRSDPPALPLHLALTRDAPLDFPEHVTVGRLNRRETLDAIRNALCVVVPSVWEDPCPTVALEALALGTPIVATNLGGLRDILQPEVNGLFVAPGDVRGLRAAVGRFVDDPQLVERLSAGALETVMRFSSAGIVPQIESVYSEVAEQAMLTESRR